MKNIYFFILIALINFKVYSTDLIIEDRVINSRDSTEKLIKEI